MDTPLFVVIPPHVITFLVTEVIKWKLNLQRIEIVAGMGKELDMPHTGGGIYQGTYILYRANGVNPSTIQTLNEIELGFITEMKEFCMNTELMISSKCNMVVMTMFRMIISNTPHLEIDPKDYLYPGTIAKVSV